MSAGTAMGSGGISRLVPSVWIDGMPGARWREMRSLVFFVDVSSSSSEDESIVVVVVVFVVVVVVV
jgi:hypothetical protein